MYDLNEIDRACPTGSYGDNCSTTCPYPSYGENCGFRCKCSADKVCSPYIGCIKINTACPTGSYGDDCSTTCPFPSYGRTVVSCVNIVPCPTGSYGDNCSTTCPYPSYGENCGFRYKCSPDEVCSPHIGCVKRSTESTSSTSIKAENDIKSMTPYIANQK
ncbi:multiple epidermal growth factor-like domains protein 6 [Ostrea edulis]|uniref:multiple epidermal growth factor-like domains protein 6 n=1 Tax=Ostrea edulis TaxID=37623 RepID=UPI0024AF712B|nr:multiple epidermal growth factor-like domains protein 6 [Ostrea edulis]XP_056009415.1 multiple epidermal growth factor-like domains protein 6 [Ostrea edulis]